ncbi:MAG: IS110 family transposase [Bacteroidota bacterium]
MDNPACPFLSAGCDVSADTLDVARLNPAGGEPAGGEPAGLQHAQFANTASGHTALIDWLQEPGLPVRLVLEASGIYGLDLMLALDEVDTVEVMVLNPRAAKDYRRAHMHRSKTDQIDAAVLCDYALRMPFTPWHPPETDAVELRWLARRIADLTVERSREKNRLHAAQATRSQSALVINDIEVNLRHLTRRIDELLRQALKLIRASSSLETAFEHLTSVRGIAAKSAILLLGELLCLPGQMSVREWVAYAGLDVRQHRSGRSVEARPRISKEGNVHIRRALYMPALVAVKWEPAVGAFYEQLVERGKPKMVAVVAVMRKLLHAIYGMLKHGADFDGSKFYAFEPKAA